MRRHLIAVFLLGALLVSITAAWAKEPATPELTLSQAVDRAISKSQTLKSAEYDIDRSYAVREASADNVLFTPTGPTTTEAEKAFTGLVKADLNWQMSKKTYQTKVDSVVMDVYNGYYSILRAQEKVKTSELALRSADLQKRKTAAFYSYGKASKLALNQAENTWQAAKNTLETNRQSLEDAYQKFNQLIGLWAEDRPQLTDRPAFEPLEISNLDTEVARVVAESPTVWQAQQNISLSKLDLDLYNFNSSSTPYEAVKIDVQKTELSAAQTEEQFRETVRSTYYAIRQMEEQYTSLQNNARIAEENLNIARMKYELGLIIAAEVAASETSLAQSNQSLLDITCQHDLLKMNFRKPWA